MNGVDGKSWMNVILLAAATAVAGDRRLVHILYTERIETICIHIPRGLANTLKQTAILKPGLKNKNVKNLYYTGQLTVPGPGVPPSLISGQVVADEVAKDFKI